MTTSIEIPELLDRAEILLEQFDHARQYYAKSGDYAATSHREVTGCCLVGGLILAAESLIGPRPYAERAAATYDGADYLRRNLGHENFEDLMQTLVDINKMPYQDSYGIPINAVIVWSDDQSHTKADILEAVRRARNAF